MAKQHIYRQPITIVDYASVKVDPTTIEIDCSLGHSPFGHPPTVDVAKLTLNEQLVAYPSGQGRTELSDRIKQRFGMQAETELYYGGGTYHLLSDVLSHLFSQEEHRDQKVRVVGVGPQFTNIKYLADRAELDYQPLEPALHLSYAKKLAVLIKNRQQAERGAVVYIDNPNNPTGDAVSQKVITQILDACRPDDVVIIDEAYGDLLPDEDSSFGLLHRYQNLIVMRSLSKTVGLAGLRLGYMAMSAPLQEVYSSLDLIFGLDSIASQLALMATDPQAFPQFLQTVKEKTKQRKTELIAVLQKHQIAVMPTHPEVSILLAKDHDHFYERLLKVGVNTSPGASFKPTHGKLDDSYVRFRIPAARKQIEQIDHKLSQLFG